MATLTTLVNFKGADGATPKGALIADAAGDLFGTTTSGGANNDGTVFELVNSGGGNYMQTTLLTFNGTNGASPVAGLIADAAGDLFGTTEVGGANAIGTVFEIAKTGTGYASTPTTLVTFDGTNGTNPIGGLIADAAGDLFGTTFEGGANGAASSDGTVFEIAKTGGGYASRPTTLVSFNGADGQLPSGDLIADAAGDLFGTTRAGGGGPNTGTVFEITKTSTGYASTPTTLVSFNGTDGSSPVAGLIADAAGNLFGTTALGGANGDGTVFEIAKTGGGYASTPTTLLTFNGTNGSSPVAGLIADAAGNLFGTTQAGGANGAGTVFELTGTDFVVCFCRGTLILTERGEMPVEELAVGDRVETLSGADKPIVWIGFGRDLVTRANKLARPVIVRRDALAENVPQRDLYLTHGHALYFDGVLIPVEHLVNHRSILWDDTARVVEYYHIELADHDVLFAEGAPAESYHDAGNRAFFQNAREGSEAGTVKLTCAPVLNAGETVERVWAELFERAGGHFERNTTDDPDLHLLVDGERLDPTTTDGSVYSFAVERPPAATLRLCSRSGVPSLLGRGRSDHRPLGVAIEQIILWHAGIPTCFDYDAPQLREGGCHLPEDGYCWSDSEFELPARFFMLLNGAFTLVVHTKQHDMRYPISGLLPQAA